MFVCVKAFSQKTCAHIDMLCGCLLDVIIHKTFPRCVHVCVSMVGLKWNLWEHPACDIIVWHLHVGRRERESREREEAKEEQVPSKVRMVKGYMRYLGVPFFN